MGRNKQTKQAKQEIMNAVKSEERFLLVYYRHVLFPQQIRGKALSNLRIPAKFGGQIDWTKLG